MAISVRKSSLKDLSKALKAKRRVGVLSSERIEIRNSIDNLKIGESIIFDLPENERKVYTSKNTNKKNTTHPLLEKIRAEVKEYNNNNGIDSTFIVLYTNNNAAHLTLHNYEDIKSCIKVGSNGVYRVNINKYDDIIDNILK
jgi:hypothetical protein